MPGGSRQHQDLATDLHFPRPRREFCPVEIGDIEPAYLDRP